MKDVPHLVACLPRLQPFTEDCVGRSSSTLRTWNPSLASVRISPEGFHFSPFHFSCYSWCLASSRRVWRGLTTLLDSMPEAIHALRCIFWCLPRYAEHADRSDRSKPSSALCICILPCSRSSFATEQFQRKQFEFSDLHCPLSRSYPL